MKALYVVRSSGVDSEEGICMMEDAQSATGFGGQVGNVAFPGKIIADSDTQKLEGKDYFMRIVEKVDGPFGEAQ